jgi:hypothetical protein
MRYNIKQPAEQFNWIVADAVAEVDNDLYREVKFTCPDVPPSVEFFLGPRRRKLCLYSLP